MRLVVGRVARPHGVRGEVVIEPRTDQPERRFAPGEVLLTDTGRSLTVVSSRPHSGRWLVHLVGVDDRTSADGLRGLELQVEADARDPDDGELYADVALIGLDVWATDENQVEAVVGSVVAVEHLPMHDLLVVELTQGGTARIPFVTAIVPEVDVPGGWLRIDPPPGLLDETLLL